MSLIWQDVSFVGVESLFDKLFGGICHQSQEKPKILDNLNGKVHFGELTAMMGPSGAGKSTLLKFITQGKNHKGCDGQLIVQTPSNEKIRASYISQDEKDHLLSNLTVYESLSYASEIKNPSSMAKSKHVELVEGIIREMDLDKIKHNVAGKCSGGERKRLAIALEMAAEKMPNVLILDEPTSGLDSYSGLNLRKLADIRGMAIISTIHQPSYEMLEYFHRVYIISKAGNCIYNGHPAEIALHLQNYNFYSNSGIANPADSIIKVASSVHRDDSEKLEKIEQPDDEREMYQYLIQNANAEELEKNKIICEKMAEDIRLNWEKVEVSNSKEVYNDGLCKSSHWTNFKLWVLLKRAARTSILKQKKLLIIRFALHACVAMLSAGLYERGIGKEDGCFIKNNATGNSNNTCSITKNSRDENLSAQNVKFQFFNLLFLMFAALMPTVLTFSSEIKVFLNEHYNGWYSTSSYYLSKTIIEIPCQLIFPCCYTYFLYVYSNQIDMDEWQGGIFGFLSWRYSAFLGITILSCFIAQGMGFLIGIVCVKSFNLTIIISTSVLLFLFLFSGFFVKTIQMGPYALLMTCLSFIRFSFECLVVILYGFNRCKVATTSNQHSNKTTTDLPASAVLYTFDLSDDHVVHGIYWLISHLLVIRTLAFVVLKYMAEPAFLRMPDFNFRCLNPIFIHKRGKQTQDKSSNMSMETVCMEL